MIRGEHQHRRHVFGGDARFDLLQHIETGDLAHVPVQEQEIRLLGDEGGEGGVRLIGAKAEGVPCALEDALQRGHIHLLIIDDEDVGAAVVVGERVEFHGRGWWWSFRKGLLRAQ